MTLVTRRFDESKRRRSKHKFDGAAAFVLKASARRRRQTDDVFVRLRARVLSSGARKRKQRFKRPTFSAHTKVAVCGGQSQAPMLAKCTFLLVALRQRVFSPCSHEAAIEMSAADLTATAAACLPPSARANKSGRPRIVARASAAVICGERHDRHCRRASARAHSRYQRPYLRVATSVNRRLSVAAAEKSAKIRAKTILASTASGAAQNVASKFFFRTQTATTTQQRACAHTKKIGTKNLARFFLFNARL